MTDRKATIDRLVDEIYDAVGSKIRLGARGTIAGALADAFDAGAASGSARLAAIDKALEPLRIEIEERAFADEDWLNLAETVWGPYGEEEEVTVERRPG